MYRCPVCGYAGLDEPSHDQFGRGSQQICSCCRIQFGYHDARRSHEELRRRWIERGMTWGSKIEPMPPGWDPREQLRAAGFEPPKQA
jgi:hypothetical protein